MAIGGTEAAKHKGLPSTLAHSVTAAAQAQATIYVVVNSGGDVGGNAVVGTGDVGRAPGDVRFSRG